MQRLFAYLTDTGSLPVLSAVDAPVTEFGSLDALFKKPTNMNNLLPEKLMSWFMSP